MAGPVTLAIDIGGSGVKLETLDDAGAPLSERQRVDTPQPATPEAVLDAVVTLAAKVPAFDRVSAGFPGVIRNGRTMTAANLATEAWIGFDLAGALEMRLGKPVRVMNDADVQGFGLIRGKGIEVVITLGTGVGSAIFRDGVIGPHIELAHHPIRKDLTYDEYLGNAALKEIGREHWNRRVERMISIVRVLTSFDVLYLGGGNAKRVDTLPPGVELGSNEAGLTGGVKLWGDGWPEG
jgi:polyphosphate glucokinase